MDERLDRYAELVVRVGANVQPGQELFLHTAVEHHDLARALARQAYRAGAAYVHVLYNDAHARRAMIELGPDEALTYTPGWQKTLVSSFTGNAMIATTGDPEPELLADLDGERVARAVQREIWELRLEQFRENSVNWCGAGAPSSCRQSGPRRAPSAQRAETARSLPAPVLGGDFDGETLAPLFATARQRGTTPLRFHPRAKPVLVDAPTIARAITRTHTFLA